MKKDIIEEKVNSIISYLKYKKYCYNKLISYNINKIGVGSDWEQKDKLVSDLDLQDTIIEINSKVESCLNSIKRNDLLDKTSEYASDNFPITVGNCTLDDLVNGSDSLVYYAFNRYLDSYIEKNIVDKQTVCPKKYEEYDEELDEETLEENVAVDSDPKEVILLSQMMELSFAEEYIQILGMEISKEKSKKRIDFHYLEMLFNNAYNLSFLLPELEKYLLDFSFKIPEKLLIYPADEFSKLEEANSDIMFPDIDFEVFETEFNKDYLKDQFIDFLTEYSTKKLTPSMKKLVLIQMIPCYNGISDEDKINIGGLVDEAAEYILELGKDYDEDTKKSLLKMVNSLSKKSECAPDYLKFTLIDEYYEKLNDVTENIYSAYQKLIKYELSNKNNTSDNSSILSELRDLLQHEKTIYQDIKKSGFLDDIEDIFVDDENYFRNYASEYEGSVEEALILRVCSKIDFYKVKIGHKEIDSDLLKDVEYMGYLAESEYNELFLWKLISERKPYLEGLDIKDKRKVSGDLDEIVFIKYFISPSYFEELLINGDSTSEYPLMSSYEKVDILGLDPVYHREVIQIQSKEKMISTISNLIIMEQDVDSFGTTDFVVSRINLDIQIMQRGPGSKKIAKGIVNKIRDKYNACANTVIGYIEGNDTDYNLSLIEECKKATGLDTDSLDNTTKTLPSNSSQLESIVSRFMNIEQTSRSSLTTNFIIDRIKLDTQITKAGPGGKDIAKEIVYRIRDRNITCIDNITGYIDESDDTRLSRLENEPILIKNKLVSRKRSK